MTTELAASSIRVESAFLSGVSFPLVNLDWNATSKPLRTVEEELISTAFAKYGNPHSCGTLTSESATSLMEESGASVLRTIGITNPDYEIQFGGEGSSYWLERLSTSLHDPSSETICVTFQEDLHSSLINNFEARFRVVKRKTFRWTRDFINFNRKTGPKRYVFLITLMSHLSGDVFDVEGFNDVFPDIGDFENVKIVVDATSWLVHRRLVPKELPFDYLVFSGHKFPGGPGSPGCIISREGTNMKISGTPNVLGISKLAISARLRYTLMDKDYSSETRDLYNYFVSAPGFGARFIVHSFDSPGSVRNTGETAVFCFSVELDDCKLLVHPQVVGLILLNAYGLQVRSGGQCAEQCLVDQPRWISLRDVDVSKTPILNPSVCRISIPPYLLTRDFVTTLKDRLNDFLRSVKYFLVFFEPGVDRWSFREDFLMLSKHPHTERRPKVKRCNTCSGLGATRYNPMEPNGKREGGDDVYGLVLYSKINRDVLKRVSSFTNTNNIPGDPFRWFAVADDVVDTV